MMVFLELSVTVEMMPMKEREEPTNGNLDMALFNTGGKAPTGLSVSRLSMCLGNEDLRV